MLLLAETSQQELPEQSFVDVGAHPCVVAAPWNSVMGDSLNASLTPGVKLTGLVVAVHQKKTVICREVPSPRRCRVLLG